MAPVARQEIWDINRRFDVGDWGRRTTTEIWPDISVIIYNFMKTGFSSCQFLGSLFSFQIRLTPVYKHFQPPIPVYWSVCSYLSRGWSCRGQAINIFDCDIVGSEFEPQSRYYVHFRINTLEKSMKNSYVVPSISLQTFFVQAFKIFVDSWKFSISLLYILWNDWPIFMISGSNKQLQ